MASTGVANAAEYAGVVTVGGIPIPGATVTASRSDKQVVTTTDQAGVFRFPDLDDGRWTIRVEMLGFATATEERAITPSLEPRQWALTLRPIEELVGSISPASSDGNSSTGPQSPGARRPSAPSRSNTSNAANPPSSSNSGNAPNSATAQNPASPSTPSD